MKEYTVENHVSSYLPEGSNWKLVWSDEFDGTELDRTKWDFRLNFWGERFDAYSDQGIVLDGNSHIELHRTEVDGRYVASHTFDTLPRVNPTVMARKSLIASKKKKAVYTGQAEQD